ncbi:MAG: pilin [bacterium]
MKSLIKNKVLFLILSFVVVFLFSSGVALAADPTGCCRYDQNDGGFSGWEPYAAVMTQEECLKKNNPSGKPPTDMMLWRQDAFPKTGTLGSDNDEYAWCMYNDTSKNIMGCCEWDYYPKQKLHKQAWNMTELACHSLKGYEVSTVAWYKGGTAESETTCKKATAPTGGGNASSGTQGGSCPTGGGNCGSGSTFSGSFSNLNNPLGTYSIPELIGRIIRALLGIVGSLALIMFVAGGLMWMTSAGNEKRVAAGKNTIIWAAIGLVVIFFAYIIVKFVLEAIGAQ